tara:strand:+ start:535 stop:1614 length:1080 start_codon:yes stop_codon:yes gene_type:complete
VNKINSYIFKITNRYVVINLLIVLSLVSFINLIEIARNLTDENQKVLNYFLLSLYKVPTIINEILPFVIIISISFLFRYLINNNELTSMRNIGYSIFDIFLPVGIYIFLFGLFNLFLLNPFSANLEKKYEEILNKKNSDVYSIKISSDIMRIKNINDDSGLNFIEIKKIDVNNMTANDIIILKLDGLNDQLITAKNGKIKNKKFYLNKVRLFDIDQNNYIEKKNLILDLNFSKENIINSIINFKNVPFYDYLNHTKTLKKFNIYSEEISLYYLSQILNPLFFVMLGFIVLGFSAKFKRNENFFKILFIAILIGFMIFFLREIIFKITLSYNINFFFSYVIIFMLPFLLGLYKVLQIEND